MLRGLKRDHFRFKKYPPLLPLLIVSRYPAKYPAFYKVYSTKTPNKQQSLKDTQLNLIKTDWRIIKHLHKYIWPKDNWGIRFRVVTSVVLLFSGKMLNVYVPYSFKTAIDNLNIDIATLDTTGSVFTVAGSALLGYVK